MARFQLSIRQRLELSVLALVASSYGLLLATTESMVRRHLYQRHEQLVMTMGPQIKQVLISTVASNHALTPAQANDRIRDLLDDYSAMRLLFWLKRPGQIPLFPRTPAVKDLAADQRLLRLADSYAAGMKKPRLFMYNGQTYFTTSLPLSDELGVLRVVQNVPLSPSSKRDNLMLLISLWLLLVLIAILVIRVITNSVIRPLTGLEAVMDDLSLQTSGVVGGERVALLSQPRELRGIADAYNRLADRLQTSWAQQQLFVRAISHELVTPLTLISGNARRLSRRSSQWPEADRQMLAAVQDEAGRMNRLIRDLLDLSRRDGENLNLKNQLVQPYGLIRSLVADLSAVSWAQRVQFVCAPSSADLAALQVRADPERLRQCLLNVIENANKYSEDDQPIVVSLVASNRLVQISITDHGPGIPEAEHELIFQPFYRSIAARKRQVGSGLGLAIVRLLIEAMGGTVSVVATEQPGTTIRFELPVVHSHA